MFGTYYLSHNVALRVLGWCSVVVTGQEAEQVYWKIYSILITVGLESTFLTIDIMVFDVLRKHRPNSYSLRYGSNTSSSYMYN